MSVNAIHRGYCYSSRHNLFLFISHFRSVINTTGKAIASIILLWKRPLVRMYIHSRLIHCLDRYQISEYSPWITCWYQFRKGYCDFLLLLSCPAYVSVLCDAFQRKSPSDYVKNTFHSHIMGCVCVSFGVIRRQLIQQNISTSSSEYKNRRRFDERYDSFLQYHWATYHKHTHAPYQKMHCIWMWKIGNEIKTTIQLWNRTRSRNSFYHHLYVSKQTDAGALIYVKYVQHSYEILHGAYLHAK